MATERPRHTRTDTYREIAGNLSEAANRASHPESAALLGRLAQHYVRLAMFVEDSTKTLQPPHLFVGEGRGRGSSPKLGRALESRQVCSGGRGPAPLNLGPAHARLNGSKG